MYAPHLVTKELTFYLTERAVKINTSKHSILTI